MTAQPDEPVDWNLATWKGSRLQQHRAFHALSFARKLELLEEMSLTAAFFARKPNVPDSGAVHEDPPREPSELCLFSTRASAISVHASATTIWARRHNDQWIVIANELTLPECFAELRSNPWFHF